MLKITEKTLSMKNDRLFQLMQERLARTDLASESQDDFILEVTATYMAELMAQGNIPHFLLNVVERDLRDELLEMYRKKTYGSMTPKHYRERAARTTSRK